MGKKTILSKTILSTNKSKMTAASQSHDIQNKVSQIGDGVINRQASDQNNDHNRLRNDSLRNDQNGFENGIQEQNQAISRASLSSPLSWQEAVADFLLHMRGTREENTERFYRERLRLLARWAEAGSIGLGTIQARHLRQYLAYRAGCGVSDMTRRHDAVAAHAFLKFCLREGYVQGDPLAGYQVPRAERAYVKCPSDEEIKTLLTAMHDRWKPSCNPSVRFIRPAARQFFSRRNYALITGLVETGARIGEMLALTLDDYQPQQGQIVIRHAKGDAPRIIPISIYWIDAVDAFLRLRPKVDSNLLFISEYGGKMDVGRFGKQFRGYLEFAGLSGFTLHGLRHYAITQLAKTDVWAASQIAGHKDLKITRQYLHGDPVHVRAVHDQAAPLARLLVNTRSEKQKRKKIV